MQRRGILFCLVGPAGSGKTTLATDLLARMGSQLRRSVSHTTRAPRPDETPGASYHFVSKADFLAQQAAGAFFESEEIHGNWYGTSRATLQEAISSGRDLLLVIDIHGALNIKRAFPSDSCLIFLSPPTFGDIAQRVQGRGPVAQAELAQRLSTAKEEYRLLQELYCSAADTPAAPASVDYLIVNQVLEEASAQLAAVVLAEKQRFARVSKDSLQELCALSPHA